MKQNIYKVTRSYEGWSRTTALCAGGLTIAFVFLFTIALAAPFIVADPQPEVTKYRVRLSADNGATWGAWAEGDPVNDTLKFDVGGIARGTYLGEAQAGGSYEVTDSATGQVSTVFEWSVSAPFVLKVKKGQKIATIRIIE